MKRVRVLLVGAKGRMGQAIAAAAEAEDAVIVAALDQGDDLAKEIDACDVVVDFSHPSATDEICRTCLGAGKPLVIGTTGHSNEERALLEKASKSVSIVFSPNFSVGVNAPRLPPSFRKAAAGIPQTSRHARPARFLSEPGSAR